MNANTIIRLAMVLLLAFAVASAMAQSTETKAAAQDEEYTAVEVMPEYPGGFAEMQKFLQQNLRYPIDAKFGNIEGTVYTEVVIMKDGSIRHLEVVKSVSPSLDKEALRLVRLMPKFKPGMQDGKPVKVRMTLPIKFRLT